MNIKQCSICHEIKDILEYYPNRHSKSGIGSACKICIKKWNREYRKKCIANGICRDCHTQKAMEGKHRCKQCSVKRNRSRKLARKGYIASRKPCIICGFEYPDIHHIDENHSNNSPENLITLCPNHHRLLHFGELDINTYIISI